MNPWDARRTQSDDLFDITSELTQTPGGGPSLTRQEFKADADVNNIVTRHGIPQFTQQPIYGDVNFDLDLQTALGAIKAAERLRAKLPEEISDKYPTPETMIAAIDNGDLAKDLEELTKEPAPAPTPPTP